MAVQTTQASSRIFISYRREDSIAHVNALFHPLRERFGQDRLFKDTDSIAPGQDFLKAIQSQLESCSVFLAVIGSKWLTVQKPKSNIRRLDDPTDYLRVEVATALRNERVRVIPILVGHASMPTAEDLPTDLGELAHRNGFELRDSRWDSDVRLLIQAIEQACGEPASAGPIPPPVPPSEPRSVVPPGGGASPTFRDTEFDLLEVRRKRQIAEHVKAARQAFEALDYEGVLEACEKAVWLDPQQGEARDLARRARRVLDEQKIQAWLVQAQELLARKELADAELAAASELIDQALSLNATYEAAVELRQEMLALRKQRERQREVDRQVRAALVRAQASFDEEDFDAAIEHCDDALAVFGESAEAVTLRSKAAAAKEEERRQRELKRRALQVVKKARAEFAADQQEAALARLEQFSPPHDLIARARNCAKSFSRSHWRANRKSVRPGRRTSSPQRALYWWLSASAMPLRNCTKRLSSDYSCLKSRLSFRRFRSRRRRWRRANARPRRDKRLNARRSAGVWKRPSARPLRPRRPGCKPPPSRSACWTLAERRRPRNANESSAPRRPGSKRSSSEVS
jgi:tetratricopeptide (TPR) repeat protein